jgi:hypothetical protein
MKIHFYQHGRVTETTTDRTLVTCAICTKKLVEADEIAEASTRNAYIRDTLLAKDYGIHRDPATGEVRSVSYGNKHWQRNDAGQFGIYCGKCGGTGFIHAYSFNEGGRCFECNGQPGALQLSKDETYPLAALAEWIPKEIKRVIRAEKAELVYMAKKKEADHAYALKVNETWTAQREAVALSEYVADEGAKVEVTGEVVFSKLIDGVYGSSMMVIIKVSDTVKVKTFSTSEWVWTDKSEKGAVLTLKGTVKKNEEYKGEKSSVLTRTKLVA